MARFLSLRLQSRVKNYIFFVCFLFIAYVIYYKLKIKNSNYDYNIYLREEDDFIDPLDIFETTTARHPRYDDESKHLEEDKQEQLMEKHREEEEAAEQKRQQLAEEEKQHQEEQQQQDNQQKLKEEEERRRQEEEDRRKEDEQQRELEEQRKQEEDLMRHQEEQQLGQRDDGRQTEGEDEEDPGHDDYVKEAEDTEYEVVIYSHDYTHSFDRFDVGKARFKFLKNFKSPCWLEDNLEPWPYNKSRMVTGPKYMKKGCFTDGLKKSKPTFIQLPEMDRKYRVRCFPYFMLLGMAKSGTSDFQSRILNSNLIFKGFSKELYWWDQYRFDPNATLSDYSDLLDFAITDMIKIKEEDTSGEPFWPGLVGEMTTITLPDMAYWREDPRNAGLKEPKYLTPHDIYPIIPNVKLIVLMRNPMTRLYSHYNMWAPLRGYHKGPEDFHMRIVNSMKWWNDCLNILPLRNCLYGSPPEMPEVEHTLSSWWPTNVNHSGEFRHGLYYLHLKEWLSGIPRENFLFLRSEDYNVDKLKTMNEEVYPFLGVPPLEGKQADNVENMPNRFQVDYAPMLAETKEILYNFYQPYNDQLAELLGEERWSWRDQPY